MKKSRKVKVNGIEYKYFIDKNAVDEDDERYVSVIIYCPNKTIRWNHSIGWSIRERRKIFPHITAKMVKDYIRANISPLQ